MCPVRSITGVFKLACFDLRQLGQNLFNKPRTWKT